MGGIRKDQNWGRGWPDCPVASVGTTDHAGGIGTNIEKMNKISNIAIKSIFSSSNK